MSCTLYNQCKQVIKINALIKSGVNYQKNQLSEFIDKLHAMIKEQEPEFEQAIIGRGKLNLNPEY